MKLLFLTLTLLASLSFSGPQSLEDTLYGAASINNVVEVQRILRSGVNVDQKAETGPGYTALQTACFFGHLPTVKLLAKAGANVNLRANNGEIAASLTFVQAVDDTDVGPILQVLMNNGLDVEAVAKVLEDTPRLTAIFAEFAAQKVSLSSLDFQPTL